MTVMFHDVKKHLTHNRLFYRPALATFDEILFADDTICTSHGTKTINKMLAAIEIEGNTNGMLLNKGKCEALIFNKPSNVHFRDGTILPKTEKAQYLGTQ